MNVQEVKRPLRWFVAAAALTGIVTVYRLWLHVLPMTVAMTMLAVVLFLAARWGQRYAILFSLAAAGCLNFFFIPPLNTFVISDPQNWLSLLVFMTVAVIGSRLAERTRMEAITARHRQHEVEVLYGLSRELLQTENVTRLLGIIAPAVQAFTNSAGCLLYVREGRRRYISGTVADAQTAEAELQQLLQRLPTADRLPSMEARIPLNLGGLPRGLLLLSQCTLSLESLVAIGSLVSIAIDRAQALEDLTRNEAARESERLRTLMLDSITHELRTPLTSIKASASTLLLPGRLEDEARRELLTVIEEETDRLNRLVGEAVEMARLDTQDIHMDVRPVSPAEIVAVAMEACGSSLDKHRLLQQMPSMPDVLADQDYAAKVLVNLLENAAKYSPPDTEITISAEATSDFVALSVADQGMGIDMSERSLIFERFYRGKSQAELTQGTGMGLAISRSIMQAHKGTLTVTSRPGGGSVFTMKLPVAVEQSETHASDAPKAVASGSATAASTT